VVLCSKLDGIGQCITNTSCQSHHDGLVGRLLNTLTFLCDDSTKTGASHIQYSSSVNARDTRMSNETCSELLQHLQNIRHAAV